MPDDLGLYPEDIALSVRNLLSTPPIEVPDENEIGERVDKLLVPRYRRPSREISAEYPSLIFFITSVYRDADRRISGERIKVKEEYDNENKLLKVTYKDYPEPSTILLDVRAYTNFDQQADIIRRAVLRRFKIPFGGITVKGQNLFCEYSGERLLSSVPDEDYNSPISEDVPNREGRQWRFRVRARLDVADSEEVSVVREYEVNTIEIREE